MADDGREERAEVLDDDGLSAEEKVEEIRALDAEDEADPVGGTMEGAAGGIASVLTLGALDALPDGEEE
jgi:hypothetical protein